ncbi:BON domain-containing protein [Terriglobus albidus]|uniref:BON domain-containing protein n=1 Tax=Terriglobus albidus TaxID=1592106 RepID=UPI0021DF9A44|nr:BON domain-containing protein [Terriglobus albidus]
MPRTLPSKFAVTVFAGCLALPLVHAQNAPDNTRQNKNESVHADRQSNAKSDVQITANVRKAIMADKDLSTYAHNVKVITKDGQVTLKGPVQSEEEKDKVFAAATSVVDSGKVVNQLTVKQ